MGPRAAERASGGPGRGGRGGPNPVIESNWDEVDEFEANQLAEKDDIEAKQKEL